MRLIAVLSFVLCVVFAAPSAHAANEMRMVVPFAAGGSADVLGRIIAQQLGAMNGGQVVVENRPGSAGIIGVEVVARGPSDGSVLLLGTIGIHAARNIYRSLPIDPDKE